MPGVKLYQQQTIANRPPRSLARQHSQRDDDSNIIFQAQDEVNIVIEVTINGFR